MTTNRQIKLTLAYDGTRYSGWQVQPDRRTVQGELEHAIERIVGSATRTTGCGRTDAGVHALRQTVTFRTDSTIPADAFYRALNTYLPDDIAVLDSEEVDPDFHPISHIVRKRYRYLVCDSQRPIVFMKPYCWQRTRKRLNVAAMHEASQFLIGKHDFSSFETTGSPRTTSVRTMFDCFVRRGNVTDTNSMFGGELEDLIAIEVEADGFLYNMVRTIAGTLVEVGRGEYPPEWVAEVLAAKDRKQAGPTAPPQGLFMIDVVYQ